MLWTVLAGFLAAPAAPWLAGKPGSRGKWLLPLVPLVLFSYFCAHILEITGTGAIETRYPWIPGLDIGLDLRLRAPKISTGEEAAGYPLDEGDAGQGLPPGFSE